jgi:hypothetical protein
MYGKQVLDTKCVFGETLQNFDITFVFQHLASYKSPAPKPTVLHAKHPLILLHINCTCNALINTPTTPTLNFMPNNSIVLKLLHGNRCTYRSLKLPPSDRTNKL